MKTSLWYDGARMQVVLTPETKFERNMLEDLQRRKLSIEWKHGEFLHTHGGYVRFADGTTLSALIVVEEIPEAKVPAIEANP